MTTETSPLNRQPDKLDYTSPTQFRFILNQIPKVQFFVQAANIPAISMGELVIPTPYKQMVLKKLVRLQIKFHNGHKPLCFFFCLTYLFTELLPATK